MPDRQEIIATNKSLRLIKNELETLYEKGVITDAVFDSIAQSLPAELSLSGASSAPTPVHSPPAPAAAMASLNLGSANRSVSSTPAPATQNGSPAPPAYSSNTNVGGPPQLPTRGGPPAVPPPTKPVIAHARALYKYQAADSRDLSFERDDAIAVHEYMNDDWWMGRNERTGAEGIFPKTYVQIDHNAAPAARSSQGYPNEKAGYYAPQQQNMGTPGGGYPPPPGPGQGAPYNANYQQPQGQPAEAGKEPSKFEEGGKKFGKKLGNAAIFGAGATIGSNIVNSIF